ncbi:hypothetical protein AX16_003032 [Volvariella volvacea WC 439]|nr:hypothetical protein AX16_003032 [Volvariella volvacea WC 439]
MVFAINPGPDGSSNSFAEFQARAIALNGTAASSAPSATSTDTYVTPPPPHWETATATITHGESVWTTIYTSYDGTPPPSPAPEPANHVILVGDGGSLSYDPPSIQANVGDTVTFEFRAKNHTVTKSSFLQPCVRSVDAVTGELGFASGFQPVPAGTTSGFPQFSITINDTAPIWGYCGQTGHCGQGMVFAINAVEDGPNNFAAFQELARRINGTRSSDPSGGDASPSGDNNGGDSGSSQDGGDDGNAAASLWRPATGAVAALVGSVVALAL